MSAMFTKKMYTVLKSGCRLPGERSDLRFDNRAFLVISVIVLRDFWHANVLSFPFQGERKSLFSWMEWLRLGAFLYILHSAYISLCSLLYYQHLYLKSFLRCNLMEHARVLGEEMRDKWRSTLFIVSRHRHGLPCLCRETTQKSSSWHTE